MSDAPARGVLFGPPVGGQQTVGDGPPVPNPSTSRRMVPPLRGVVRPEPITGTISGHLVVMGFSVANPNANNPIAFNLINGLDATGLVFAPVALVPSETRTDWYGPQGIHLDVGYFCQLTSGTPTGSVWVRDWDWAGSDTELPLYLADTEG